MTTKEISKNTAIACKKICIAMKAANIFKDYTFFNEEKYKKSGLNKLIKDTCKKYSVRESHIRKILNIEL